MCRYRSNIPKVISTQIQRKHRVTNIQRPRKGLKKRATEVVTKFKAWPGLYQKFPGVRWSEWDSEACRNSEDPARKSFRKWTLHLNRTKGAANMWGAYSAKLDGNPRRVDVPGRDRQHLSSRSPSCSSWRLHFRNQKWPLARQSTARFLPRTWIELLSAFSACPTTSRTNTVDPSILA